MDEISEKVCEKCGKPMVLKTGRYGKFLACSGYPDCKNTESINSTGNGKKTGVKCPEKECTGDLVERKSKRVSYRNAMELLECNSVIDNDFRKRMLFFHHAKQFQH